jgi:RNA recognition motif-containing protein
LGLSNRDDKERDTISRELVDREANQQTEVANLDSSAKPVYTDQCTVFLSNLSLEVTEEQLRRFFSDTGGVVAIRLLRDRFSGKPRGLAYIDFENEEKDFFSCGKEQAEVARQKDQYCSVKVQNKVTESFGSQLKQCYSW